jgi:DNA gyrase/topoisomerase IV subunit A
MFLKAKFQSNVSMRQSYDEDTQFNEQNIRNYLAELEEYISNLITIIAYERDDPNAAISSVPLEKLTPKEFDAREMQIDAPTEQVTDAGEDPLSLDEEGIVDSKTLYKNFMAHVEQDNKK